MIPRDDVISIIYDWLMYAMVSVRKTVSLRRVAMPHEGPARPAAVTPQLLSNVHQVTNALQNPENPSVSATSSGSTATVSSSVTSVQNSKPAHVVLSSSTTTVPSTFTTSVTPSPTPSLPENSQSNFEVRRFIYCLFFGFSCCTKVFLVEYGSNLCKRPIPGDSLLSSFLFLAWFFNTCIALLASVNL